MQVYSLISSLKTYHPTLPFIPWSLNLLIRVPFQLHGEHTVLRPSLFYQVLIFTWVKWRIWEWSVFSQRHNILPMSQDWEGRNMIFLWKSCTKRDSKPHGRQRHWESATLLPLRHVHLTCKRGNEFLSPFTSRPTTGWRLYVYSNDINIECVLSDLNLIKHGQKHLEGPHELSWIGRMLIMQSADCNKKFKNNNNFNFDGKRPLYYSDGGITTNVYVICPSELKGLISHSLEWLIRPFELRKDVVFQDQLGHQH